MYGKNQYVDGLTERLGMGYHQSLTPLAPVVRTIFILDRPVLSTVHDILAVSHLVFRNPNGI